MTVALAIDVTWTLARHLHTVHWLALDIALPVIHLQHFYSDCLQLMQVDRSDAATTPKAR